MVKKLSFKWLRSMTKSEQVMSTVLSAVVTGTFAIIGTHFFDSSTSKPEAKSGAQNSIDHSTVNQYFAPQILGTGSGTSPTLGPGPRPRRDHALRPAPQLRHRP